MIWQNPIAWVGALAVIAPILIHILVQRRAERMPFPTLRFLQPTRLAAIRRHVLDDLALLIVRAVALVAVAGALAGPVLLTPARRDGWNARIVRAIVTDDGSARRPQPGAAAFLDATFASNDLRDGVARAVAWLAGAPPARRELLLVSRFPLGTIDRRDFTGVPADIGIRFLRIGEIESRRSFAVPPVWYTEGAPFALSGERSTVQQRDRMVALDGPRTSAVDSVSTPAPAVPIEIVGPPEAVRVAEAALAAVLSQRTSAIGPGRAARIVMLPADRTDTEVRRAPLQRGRAGVEGTAQSSAGTARAVPYGSGSPPPTPWMADAIARIATDPDLDGVDLNGRPLIDATADGATLVVTSTAPATDPVTPVLLRAVVRALAPHADPMDWTRTASAEREVLSIPDSDLRAWERPAGAAALRMIVDQDDRRWWWAAVLLLLAFETVMRGTRADRPAIPDVSSREASRVA